jgi:hypothetical protein
MNQPTIMNKPTKMNHLTKKTKKQQKAKPEGFTKAKTKNSRTETVSVPPKTPEKSINMSFSNMSSPTSIILGIDDHPNVSPIQTDLLGLFSEFTCAFNVGSSITINVSLSALFNFLFLCVDFNGDITWVGALNKPNKSV